MNDAMNFYDTQMQQTSHQLSHYANCKDNLLAWSRKDNQDRGIHRLGQGRLRNIHAQAWHWLRKCPAQAYPFS